ncbi:insulinase family protein [Candidatus Pacearchaeota archaeon]|nr:insulinase family protein [Candidatus Pacearchaeota archaeon]
MKKGFQKKVLKNGMTILFEKRDLPIVSVAFAIKTGGIHEPLEKKGISHFIEHMLYKGTPTRDAKKIAEEIEKNGGVLNGFTDEIITAYWCKIPSKHLNIALEVLSDMVKNPVFDSKEFEKERKVIFEEIKMRKDNPGIYVLDEIQRMLYEKPFGNPLIGTYETMNSITRNEMLKRFQEIYQPNNMILCVVGDADFSEIMDFAERNFGNIKGKVPQFKIVEKNESKTEKRKGIDQVNLIFAYHSPKYSDKKSYASDVLTTLMAGGMSSRLFSEIREKRNLAYAVKGDNAINRDYSFSFIKVGTTKEKMNEVKKLILEEFEKVAKELGEKELKETKEQIIGNYQIEMEDSQEQMVALLACEINGRAEDFYEYEKNIMNVKLNDVKELAKKALEKNSFFALVPE